MAAFRAGRSVAIAVIFCVAGNPSAWAWGRLGHRVAGKVAEDRLSPSAKAAIRDLLEPGESLADVSTWADEVRSDRPESGPWHYVNVPSTEDRFDMKFSPRESGSVITAIAAQRKILADKTATKASRRDALKFLVHFLQDMHQPLHVGHRNDKGGNLLQVQFFGKGSNLHRVWDSGIIEQHSKDEAQWIREVNALATTENAIRWSTGSVEEWATESLRASKKAYLDGTIKPGAKLGDDYETMALPIVRQRLAQAGTRVASDLNRIFP